VIVDNAVILKAMRPVNVDAYGKSFARDYYLFNRRCRFDTRQSQRMLPDGAFFQQDGELDVEAPCEVRVGDLVWVKSDDEERVEVYRVATGDHVHNLHGDAVYFTFSVTLNPLAQEGDADYPEEYRT
jgi:hypothetical protein